MTIKGQFLLQSNAALAFNHPFYATYPLDSKKTFFESLNVLCAAFLAKKFNWGTLLSSKGNAQTLKQIILF